MRIEVSALLLAIALTGCGNTSPPADPANPPLRTQSSVPASELEAQHYNGLWTGTWGGGESDGVVIQPVVTEVFIDGDQIEISHLRSFGRASGTVQIDETAKRFVVTAKETSKDEPPKTVEYTYRQDRGQLQLTDADGITATLSRDVSAVNPLMQISVELVSIISINEARELTVEEFRTKGIIGTESVLYHPRQRVLPTKDATVLLVSEGEASEISIEDARKRIIPPAVIALIYRPEGLHPDTKTEDALTKYLMSPPPDSNAVRRTLTRSLSPGTLVFILPKSASVPLP